MDSTHSGLTSSSPLVSEVALTPDTNANHSTEAAPNTDYIPGVTIAYIVIGLFGFLGNFFVLLIILKSKKMQKSVINKLILYQSFLDGMAAFWILITCNIRYGGTVPDESLKEQVKCVVWNTKMFMWALFLASTFNLVVITLERYMAMVHPMTHKSMTTSRVYLMMILPTVVAFVFQVAQISATSRIVDRKCRLFSEFPSTAVEQFYIIFSATFQFYIPLLIMIVAYGHIALVLYKRSQERLRTSSGTRPNFEEQRSDRYRKASVNILKTLVLVCFLFAICWAGNTTSFVLLAFGHIPNFVKTPWYHISTCLCFVNCAVNPFIYSLQYKEFKMAAYRLFSSVKSRNDGAVELSGSSTSKSTNTTN